MMYGRIHPDFEPLRDAFGEVLRADDAGASLAVVRDGELVVDLWGGTDPLSGRAWESDSITTAFSAAKGVSAIVVARAIQAGALDPRARVAAYWPEFAAAGKAEITVADVLTHVAGLPTLPLSAPTDLLDSDALAARIAAAPPDFAPRSARVYHVLSYGVIVGEILRRITGTDVGTLVREQIAAPLDASLWLGLPEAEDDRYRPVLMDPIVPPPVPEGIGSGDATACEASYRSTAQIVPLFERVGGVIGTELVNGEAFRRAVIPAGGLISDARSLARVYGACVAPVDGIRLLDDETVRLVGQDWLGGIAEPLCWPGAVPTTRWGLGFEIAHELAPMLGEGSFGHTGMGGRLAFAHPASRTGFAFVGQRMRFPAPGTEPRWALLLGAMS